MSLMAVVVYGAILGAAVFAWIQGGRVEQWGATFNVVAAILVDMAHRLVAPGALPIALLTVDGLLGLAFLALALGHASLWLGAALVFQSIQFALHASYLVRHLALDVSYARINNMDTLGVALSLAIAVAGAHRRTPALAPHA